MKKGMISKVAASAILAGAFVLSGCGNSKKATVTEEPDAVTYGVSGNASYVGKIFRGDVKVYDANNNELGSTALNTNGTYSIAGLTTQPSYVELQTGAKGVGNDGVANSDDDNRITLALSSDIDNSTANLSLSSYLNKEYSLNVPSELTLAQKQYLLNIQEALVYLNIPYNDAFKYAGTALTEPINTSGYSVLSTGVSTAKLLNIPALKDLLTAEQETILEAISDAIMSITTGYTGTAEQKKETSRTLEVVMSAVKELATDGLKSDDVVAIQKVTSPDTVAVVKDWVKKNIDENVNFNTQGVKMARTAITNVANQNNDPIIDVDDTPTIITTCSNLDMSGSAAVVCGPEADNFKFSADFGDLGPIDNDKNTPDGGLLLYMASSDLDDVTPEVAQSGKGENRIEHTWVEKKYIRLNSAALALSSDAKFDLLKDYIEPLFTIKGNFFENDNNPFTLDQGQKRTFAATMVLHFTNDQAESTPNKEYLSATIQIDVTRSGDKCYFSRPAGSDILLTAKKLDSTTGTMIVTQNGDLDDATIGNEFSFNIGKYFDRLIAAGGNASITSTAKDILVKNSTQKGPIKIHLTLHEKLPNGSYDRSFIRNPGTFNPANFGLSVGGSSNPYLDAFDDGAVQAIKFKLILE